MHLISLGMNQSCYNRLLVQIVPPLYSTVFVAQTLLCMILHGIVLHDIARYDEWVRVVANISGWRIFLSKGRSFMVSGFVSLFNTMGGGFLLFLLSYGEVLGKIAHFKSRNKKLLNHTKNIHKIISLLVAMAGYGIRTVHKYQALIGMKWSHLVLNLAFALSWVRSLVQAKIRTFKCPKWVF